MRPLLLGIGVDRPRGPALRGCMALVGYLDEITREQVRGWAGDPERPDEPVLLEVLVDGRPVASIVANGHRPDIELAGIGDGRHGFGIELSRLAAPITAAVVHVQRRDTAEQLVGSPVRLDAPLELDEPARRAMVALLRSPGTGQVLRERVALVILSVPTDTIYLDAGIREYFELGTPDLRPLASAARAASA